MMIKAVLFDFDGTLTAPGAIDFAGIRRAVGCGEEQPILEYIEGIADSEERSRANAVLDEHEMAAAAKSMPNAGAETTVSQLAEMGMPVSVLTRNCRRAVERSLENFSALRGSDFVITLSRDDGIRPKPDPEGVYRAALAMQVPVETILCVGDYVFDVELAKNAGCLSAYLSPSGVEPAIKPDYLIGRLDQVLDIVEGRI
jgi:phosphoglycolate phosphatase-like HAD superfamily hydrolase